MLKPGDQGYEHHGYDDHRHEPDLKSPCHHELLSDYLLMFHGSLEPSDTNAKMNQDCTIQDARSKITFERQIRNPKH